MCILCAAHERKVEQFKRALAQPLDPLSAERIALALCEIQGIWPKCRESWRVKQRVARTEYDELGTIVEAGQTIKVRWDGGATSYYKSHMPAKIRLEPDE